MWKMGANCTTATQRMEDINKRRNKAATKTEAIKYPCVCVCVSVFILLLVFFQLRSKSQLGKWKIGKWTQGHCKWVEWGREKKCKITLLT